MCFASQVAVLSSALASYEELEEYKDAFELFDRNGDGLLDASELRPAICLLGHEPTPQEVQGWLKEFDRGEKSALSLPEFAAMMLAKTCLAEDPIALREAFRVFDRSGTGTVSKEDFVSRMRLIGEAIDDAELSELFETLGGHGDEITFSEFRNFAKMFGGDEQTSPQWFPIETCQSLREGVWCFPTEALGSADQRDAALAAVGGA